LGKFFQTKIFTFASSISLDKEKIFHILIILNLGRLAENFGLAVVTLIQSAQDRKKQLLYKGKGKGRQC